ncbi:MAG: hypothetical protein ABI051_09295 [Vicinamibacterales bacterium]
MPAVRRVVEAGDTPPRSAPAGRSGVVTLPLSRGVADRPVDWGLAVGAVRAAGADRAGLGDGSERADGG